MAKRIVLTCWGSYGDLFPYLAIAIRLREQGHTPVLATCAFYRDMVEGAGIEFRAVRPDVDPADTETLRRVMDPVHGTEVIVREMLAPVVRDALADVTEAIRAADLVVSHPVTFATPIAADRLGVPWLASVLAPASMFSVHDCPLMPPHPGVFRLARRAPWMARAFRGLARRVTRDWLAPVRSLRAELGLPDRGHPLFEGQFSPRGTLALFSPLFGPPQADWPPGSVATGFVFHRAETVLSADVASFLDDGEPPIVFTLGSSAVGAAGAFFRESVEAARRLGRRALLLVGRDPRNRSNLSLPKTMLVAEFAAHDLVFPRAAVVVHHGGIGTTAQALRSGRPMLVVPHAHDQPDNAYRARKLGVAQVIDARHYTARRVLTAVGKLLEDRRHVAAATGMAGLLRREDGLARAVDALLTA